MLLTVVIMAYNRKKYLKDAIESALNQDLDKQYFEILLIKNFEDAELDSLCSQAGVSLIRTGNVPIGKYLEIAVQTAKGEVIAFLDDDDVFEKNKLKRVFDAFSKHPELIYYKNDWSLIDSSGKQTVRRRKKEKESGMDLQTYSVEHAIKRIGPRFRWNMSCLSVRKEAFLGFEGYTPTIACAQDLSIFYMAASKERHMAFDPQLLTRYRQHGESMTKVKGPDNDSLREYNTLKVLDDFIADKMLKEDLVKALSKLRTLSVWDGSDITKKDFSRLLRKLFSTRIYNSNDLKLLGFTFFVFLVFSLSGGKGIRFLRNGVDLFWAYEENF